MPLRQLFRFNISVSQFRFWGTLLILCLGAVAAAVSWLLIHTLPTVTATDQYGLPIICLTFMLAGLWLITHQESVNSIQLCILLVGATYMLFDLHATGLPRDLSEDRFGAGIPWFSLGTILAYLGLQPHNALRFGIFYNAIALLISFWHFRTGISQAQFNSVLQFHAANLSILTLITFFGRMQQQFNVVQRQAHTDALTNIENRRAMQQHLEQIHNSNTPYVLIMLDVDHFKSVNDHYGHPFGDIVLRELAFCLSNLTRHGDHVARWGGEEFLVLANNTSLEQAQELAERLRKGILEANPGGIRITVSIGLASRKTNETLEQTLARVDVALFSAKKSGRDQIRSTQIG